MTKTYYLKYVFTNLNVLFIQIRVLQCLLALSNVWFCFKLLIIIPEYLMHRMVSFFVAKKNCQKGCDMMEFVLICASVFYNLPQMHPVHCMYN